MEHRFENKTISLLKYCNKNLFNIFDSTFLIPLIVVQCLIAKIIQEEIDKKTNKEMTEIIIEREAKPTQEEKLAFGINLSNIKIINSGEWKEVPEGTKIDVQVTIRSGVTINLCPNEKKGPGGGSRMHREKIGRLAKRFWNSIEGSAKIHQEMGGEKIQLTQQTYTDVGGKEQEFLVCILIKKKD